MMIKSVLYDKKWVQADPVTLVPMPSIQACLGLFLTSYKKEQERAGERDMYDGWR